MADAPKEVIKSKASTPKPRTLLPPKKLQAIRAAYCAGVDSLAAIGRQHKTKSQTIKDLAKKFGWERGSRPAQAFKVDGEQVLYVGPLTVEERAKIAQVTGQMVSDMTDFHGRLTRKVLIMCELMIDKIIAKDGMKTVEFMADGMKEPVKLEVSAVEDLVNISKVLAKQIPLERIAHGLEPNIGVAGQSEELARAEQKRAVFVDGMISHFEGRVAERRAAAKLAAPK